MKTKSVFRYSLTILILICIGCSKGTLELDLSYLQYDFTNGKIEAIIDGDFVSFPTMPAHDFSSGNVSIKGKSCKENLHIGLLFSGSIGTHDLSVLEVLQILENCKPIGDALSSEYLVEEGYVTVIENSELGVKGTFSFTCMNRSGGTKTVTDGTFDVGKYNPNQQ